MILQALKVYYDRKAADPESDIAPEGWIRVRIDYEIIIDENGNFVQLNNKRENKLGFPALVPNIGKQAAKHNNSGKDANLLWDKPGFVLGNGNKGEIKLSSFIKTIDTWFNDGQDMAVDAVRKFLLAGKSNRSVFSSIINHPDIGQDIQNDRGNITFKFIGDDGFVFERPIVKRVISSSIAESADNLPQSICLVTGKRSAIVDCHPVVTGLYGAKKNPNLVSFNEYAFCSFGKSKSYNAPVSRKAVDSYTKALSLLIRSKQRINVGDATTIFWSEKASTLENDAFYFFSEPPKDDPDRNTAAVKILYESIWSGSYVVPEESTRFYVLGLSPNAARIAVRFWHVGTVKEMGTRFKQHVDDLAITHSAKVNTALPMRVLLRSIATQQKDDNIPPNLAGDFMRSILEGIPYPATLLQAAVRRSRAEQAKKNKNTGKPEPNVPYERAALIKACLNRSMRFNNPQNEKEIAMCLDEENTNIGYRLGRLFAVLEKIQTDANPGLNATIRDRFYGAASSTPVVVFANLMRLSNHHLSKLEKEKPGLVVRHKQLLGQIMCQINDFPAHLVLADQGRFAIGYYHQTQDLWTKKA